MQCGNGHRRIGLKFQYRKGLLQMRAKAFTYFERCYNSLKYVTFYIEQVNKKLSQNHASRQEQNRRFTDRPNYGWPVYRSIKI